MRKTMIAGLTALCLLAGSNAFAGGTSVCEFGVSTPTAATLVCATAASTLYGIETSSVPLNIAGNLEAFFECYNAAAATGIILGTESINTTKLATVRVDTTKVTGDFNERPRNASTGITCTKSHTAVSGKIIYSTP